MKIELGGMLLKSHLQIQVLTYAYSCVPVKGYFLKLTREPFADGKYTAYCVTATEAPGQYYGRSQSVTR